MRGLLSLRRPRGPLTQFTPFARAALLSFHLFGSASVVFAPPPGNWEPGQPGERGESAGCPRLAARHAARQPQGGGVATGSACSACFPGTCEAAAAGSSGRARKVLTALRFPSLTFRRGELVFCHFRLAKASPRLPGSGCWAAGLPFSPSCSFGSERTGRAVRGVFAQTATKGFSFRASQL